MKKFKVVGSVPSLNTLTKNSLLIPAIDMLLMKDSGTEDRGHGWNSPSGIGGCMRASYYNRCFAKKTNANDDPRSLRILNNGTFVHERLQGYLKEAGVLLLDEAPVFNVEYEVMGNTDGLLKDGDRLSILEIKSINSNGFNALTDAKPEHKLQASLYMYCLDEMRKKVLLGDGEWLRNLYKTKLESFLEDGRKYTKEQKLEKKMAIFDKTLELLEKYPKPIRKIIFLYECKDTQELKEFPFEWDRDLISDLLNRCKEINKYVAEGIIPKKDNTRYCKWCAFKDLCERGN